MTDKEDGFTSGDWYASSPETFALSAETMARLTELADQLTDFCKENRIPLVACAVTAQDPHVYSTLANTVFPCPERVPAGLLAIHALITLGLGDEAQDVMDDVSALAQDRGIRNNTLKLVN